MMLVTSRVAIASAAALFAAGANAALLDFTIDTGNNETTSGFVVEAFTAVGTLPSGVFSGGNIAKEAGFADLLIDVNGENLDVYISDTGTGNPYIDNVSGGKYGGLGSCRAFKGNSQCNPSSDDNLTATTNSGEILSLLFQTDSGDATTAVFGDFFFRDDKHNAINGTIQVSADGISYLIGVTGGIGDLSVISAGAQQLEFNAETGSTDNFYVAQANIALVPVPAAVWLFGSALAALAWVRRKQSA